MEGDEDRQQGVQLCEFGEAIEAVDYPTTADALVARFGEMEVTLTDGAETVAELLGPLDDEFEGPEEVRQTVYNMVGDEAVGRERYTDRTTGDGDNLPPDEEEDVSF